MYNLNLNIHFISFHTIILSYLLINAYFFYSICNFLLVSFDLFCTALAIQICSYVIPIKHIKLERSPLLCPNHVMHHIPRALT